MSEPFFTEVESPIRYEGPESDEPLAFRWYDADRVVAGRRMEDHLRFAVCYWHSSRGTGSTSSVPARWTARGIRPSPGARTRWPRPTRRWTPRSSSSPSSGCPSTASTTVTSRPRGRLQGVDRAPRRDGRRGRGSPGAHRRDAPLGHREPLLQPALPGRRRDQPRPGGVRLRRRPGGALPGGDAPPRGPQLRPVGRARGLRDAAQHRHAPRARPARAVPRDGGRAQAPHRVHGHDPHRAEAVRADQAPVRLRRRRGVGVPPALRPRRRGEGQHRGQPRHARRSRLRPRDRRRGRRGDPRARSMPTPATTASGGTSTASRCRWSR